MMTHLQQLKRPERCTRQGFTLVEILVVIVIIGILMGIAIPAINGVIGTAREAAIRVEIDVVGQALEAYSLKYGSLPPDFSDWNQVERHYRKAFPNIDDSELQVLAQLTWVNSNFERVSLTSGNVDPRGAAGFAYYRPCMDPAEALVFTLGGYSSDARFPFTGPGGPLSLISSPGGSVTADYGLVQYNTDRDNAFIDLDTDSLSVYVANDPTASPATENPAGAGSAYTYSSDEFTTSVAGTSAQTAYSTRASAGTFSAIRFLVDPFPVYAPDEDAGPLVYFSSKSYQNTFAPSTNGWMGTGTAFHNLNMYMHPAGNSDRGIARPYLTDQLDTNAGGFLWAEPDKFQIISAGRDNSFGGSVADGSSTITSGSTTVQDFGLVSLYPTGGFANALGATSSSTKYADPESIYGAENTPQLDNITNFSTRTLESDLP